MERKRLLYWMVQVTGWSIYFLISILLLFSTNDFRLTANLFIYIALSIIVSILLSHGIRYVIIWKDLLNRKASQLVLTTVMISIVAAFSLETFQHLTTEYAIEVDFIVNDEEDNKADDEEETAVYSQGDEVGENGEETTAAGEEETAGGGKDDDVPFEWAPFLYWVSRSLILFLLWCGFYYAFAINEKSRAQEILNLKWEASKNEIELKNLRAQLNPHFLFNSLNSIRALVGINPDQAKTSVTQLSTLLRRSINLGKMKVIPLKEELDLVKIYLDLEQIRFEERLQTEFDIDQNTLQCEIPPLMVQTIVENGIKHGISKSIEGGVIRVVAVKNENGLEITISNSGKLDPNSDSTGIGIKNSKKRLNLLFGKNADFSIRQIADDVVVKIRIRYK